MFNIERWLPFLLAKSHQITFNLMKSAVEEFDLTPPQFATLAFLWQHDGINLQELGVLMSVDRTTIGGIISRLEKLDYVKKEDDFEDRRSCILYVSEKGYAIQAEVLQALNEVTIGIDLQLTEKEQDQLVQLLTKFRQGWIGNKN